MNKSLYLDHSVDMPSFASSFAGSMGKRLSLGETTGLATAER
ncbi:MAG: hypothetical protein ABF747_05515 [Bifidobacterium sp.]